MKRITACFLAALMMCAACACAAAEDAIMATLAGLEWSFSSGVGGWSTDLRILEDGSFSGEYHDSEMGETGDGYPDGTVYCCSFTGRMSTVGQADGTAGGSGWMNCARTAARPKKRSTAAYGL